MTHDRVKSNSSMYAIPQKYGVVLLGLFFLGGMGGGLFSLETS